MADRILALIVAGAVANLIAAPADWPAPEGDAYVDVTAQSPAPQIGWTYDGEAKAFAPPPVPAPTAGQLAIYAAARRYEVETGGVLLNGAAVATDRESQSMIANAFAYVQASSASAVSYKSPAGFITLTADQIKTVALAVGAHVQACFKAEDDADAGISAVPPTITTREQIDAVFALLTPAAPTTPAS